MNARRHQPIDLADRTGKFNFLALFQTHTFDRLARSHRNIGNRIISVRYRLRQPLRGKGHTRTVIVGNRHNNITSRRVQNDIDTAVFEGINDTGLFSFGKRGVEGCAFWLLRYHEKGQTNHRNDDGTGSWQGLTQAFATCHPLHHGHNAGCRLGDKFG